MTKLPSFFLIFLVSFFLLGAIPELDAQQLPLFTQYREYHSILNPATINSDYFTHEYNVSFGASYRVQWDAQSFTPRTQVARFEYLFTEGKQAGLILGGHVINDQVGPMGTTGASVRTGVLLSDDPDWWGLVGSLSVGLTQFRINKNKIESYDPLLNQCDCQSIRPDLGIGLFAYKRFSRGFFDQDVIYGGLSIPQVLAFDPVFITEESETTFSRVAHYYGLAGLYKQLADYKFFETSLWVKYVPNAPVNVDVNVRYAPVEYFWIGIGYASSKTFHFELGFLLGENIGWDNTMRLGYGIDRGINAYGPIFGLSHEVNISYALE